MPYNDDDKNNIGDVPAAIAAGAALGNPRGLPETTVPTGLYTVVPEGYKLESLETFMGRPLRVRQKVELHDAASFIDYVQEFGDHEVSRIFFDQEHEVFQIIIDYHEGNGMPGWCNHIAGFTARRSVEFTTWMGQNRKQMTQVDFARFLEDNIPDIVEPNSADLLQVALTFEAKKSVEFSSGVRLNNGQIQFHVRRGRPRHGAEGNARGARAVRSRASRSTSAGPPTGSRFGSGGGSRKGRPSSGTRSCARTGSWKTP